MKCQILILLMLLIGSICQKCPADKPQTMLSFHPHLDAFWLNTENELRDANFIPASFLYQMAQRNSKQIFNSMYDALIDQEGPLDRRYFVSEMFFMKDWYDYVDTAKQQKFKQLIKSGKLEMVNMGWVENDEAVCYYDDIIEQYTVGMNWLYETFNYIGRVGWATDAFGHSQSMAALQNELGIEMQGTERLDDRYTHYRNGGPLLQFYWNAKSYSNNLTYGGLMTHCKWFPHEPADYLRYMAPAQVATEMRQIQKVMKDLYKKPIMFRFFGNDFEQFLKKEFKTLQDTVDLLNREAGCQWFRYGNPSEYMVKLQEHFKSNKLESRDYDMIPNWDYGNYWTGYYTTDPALKKMCKDYSRLINLYKKLIVRKLKDNKSLLQQKLIAVTKAQELLALMQHHDGITATSKHHVQIDMERKMESSIKTIIEDIKGLEGLTDQVQCNLLSSNHVCVLPTTITGKFSLTLINSGGFRRKRVEIKLPKEKYYNPDSDHSWEFLCLDKDGFSDCSMVFDLVLPPGETKLAFSASDKETLRQYTLFPQDALEGSFENGKFSIQNNVQFVYEYAGQKIKLSYVMSQANGITKDTRNWTKYGQQTRIRYHVPSGFYIMSNDGTVMNYGGKITSSRAIIGSSFAKIELTFQEKIKTLITIDKSQPFALDVITNFEPKANTLSDYFIRVESSINAGKDMYHDSNGYLVMKRTQGWRPDYELDDEEVDKINSNIYPSTSFAYRTDGKKKIVVSVDRAEGIALYNTNEMLVNIDRLAADDRKGAAESYPYVVKNTFRHRIAVTDLKDNWERRCQKDLDEGIMGFIHQSNEAETASPIQKQADTKANQNLKYTTALLNSHTVLLRLQNLAEHEDLTVTLYQNKQITLPYFGLSLPFKDIKETFHSGIPLTSRYEWLNNDSPTNVDIHKNKFDSPKITLRPLQIRSFRIDLEKDIAINEPFKIAQSAPKSLETLQLRRHLRTQSTSVRCF